MESLYLLIPVSVVLVFLIGLVFWWSLKSGQMEDLEGPAYRLLMDDDGPCEADKQGESLGQGGCSPTSEILLTQIKAPASDKTHTSS
jgi:cbb3-type cytochrome oxidase maturation protein